MRSGSWLWILLVVTFLTLAATADGRQQNGLPTVEDAWTAKPAVAAPFPFNIVLRNMRAATGELEMLPLD